MWLVYLGIALFATWPLARHPITSISMGFEAETAVPLLNVWTLWWNSDRLAAGLQNYWDAPIFYPTRGAFAFSEAQPTMMIVAPLVWLTGSRALAYNVYLWLVLSLNGFSSQRLLRRAGRHPVLAMFGGVLCQMLPFVWWQLGVIQLTTLFGINWTIHALSDVFELPGPGAPEPSDDPFRWRRSTRNAVRLGASFCVTYFLCNYWGLFLVLVLVPASVAFLNRHVLRLRFWYQLCLAATIVAAIVGPWASYQKSLASKHEWVREKNTILELSAYPRDYLSTPRTAPTRVTSVAGPQIIPPYEPNNRVVWSIVPQWDAADVIRKDFWPLGPGMVKVALAPIGLLIALCSRGHRRWGLFAAILLSVAFGLSMGPYVHIAPWVPFLAGICPYEILQKTIPGFALIRSPFRFALFVQLAVVWLNIEALDLLNPSRWRRQAPVDHLTGDDADILTRLQAARAASSTQYRPTTVICWFCLVTAGLFLSIEVWPPRQSICTCPSGRNPPAWVLWLRDNSKPQDPMICLPFPTGYTVDAYQDTAAWMYWGTMHGHPLHNGYSGFFPKSFVDLKQELHNYYGAADSSPPPQQLKLYPWDSPALKHLNDGSVRYAIVKRTFASRDDVWQHPATKFRWAWVMSDEQHDLDVYEIQIEQPE